MLEMKNRIVPEIKDLFDERIPPLRTANSPTKEFLRQLEKNYRHRQPKYPMMWTQFIFRI